MDNTSNVTAWVVGAIIVILALVGIWWVATGGSNNSVGVPNTGAPSTDTTNSSSSSY